MCTHAICSILQFNVESKHSFFFIVILKLLFSSIESFQFWCESLFFLFFNLWFERGEWNLPNSCSRDSVSVDINFGHKNSQSLSQQVLFNERSCIRVFFSIKITWDDRSKFKKFFWIRVVLVFEPIYGLFEALNGFSKVSKIFSRYSESKWVENRGFGQKITLPLFSGDPLLIGSWSFRQHIVCIILFLFLNKGQTTRCLHFILFYFKKRGLAHESNLLLLGQMHS